MSVKRSQLESKVVPIVQGLLSREIQLPAMFPNETLCDIFVGRVATEITMNMYGKDASAKKQHRVLVTTLSDEAAKLMKDELKAKTFSFNISMVDCYDLVCYQTWWNGDKHAAGGRPRLIVCRGKSPGFCVFVHNNEILAAVNMYHSNFMSWADRIGLRKTMFARTSIPSTHFVYAKEAKESGLLWINPKLEWM